MGPRIWDTGYGRQDTGYRIQDAGYRMQDTGCRIQDTGYRISWIMDLGSAARSAAPSRILDPASFTPCAPSPLPG